MPVLILVVWLCAPLSAGAECEIYIAERPAADLRECQFRRHELALEALALVGRELRPRETIRAKCRLVQGAAPRAARQLRSRFWSRER